MWRLAMGKRSDVTETRVGERYEYRAVGEFRFVGLLEAPKMDPQSPVPTLIDASHLRLQLHPYVHRYVGCLGWPSLQSGT